MSRKWQKGRVHERFVARMLADAGWIVHLVQPSLVYISSLKRYLARPQDVFGADMIAMKPGRLILFCQVTTDSNIKRKIEKLRRYPYPFDIVWVLICQAKKQANRWKYRFYRVDLYAAEPASKYCLEDILGRAFEKYKDRLICPEI